VAKQSFGQFTLNGFDEFGKSKNVAAKLNHLKTVKAYSFSNKFSKKGKLILQENYDTLGNITSRVDHHYYRYKDFEETTYAYDTVGRIQNIVSKVSFSGGYVHYYGLSYGTNNRINYTISDFGMPDKLIFDTLHYSYFEDGRINYKWKRKYEFGVLSGVDTSYYNYNNYGNALISRNKQADTHDFAIRDQNGCMIGYKDTSEEKYTQRCDSLCRVLSYKDEILSAGKWITIGLGEFQYSGENLVEEKHYLNSRKILDCGKARIKFDNWIKYEYDQRGFLIRETEFTKSGKVKTIQKYVYESYSH
jgi:hypothetical protein